jgi:hypothetical protein
MEGWNAIGGDGGAELVWSNEVAWRSGRGV